MPNTSAVAAAGVAVEALLLLGYGAYLGIETLTATPSNRDVAAGSAVLATSLALLVGVVAWATARGQSWSRGAAITVQLLAVPLAWTMLTGGLPAGGVPLGLVALATLAALLRRRESTH